MANNNYRIVALPGEGVGAEVVEAALLVLKHLAVRHQFTVEVVRGWIGAPAVQRFGVGLPEVTIQQCQTSDGILLGAVTNTGLLELRQRLDLFANLRPVRPSPWLWQQSALKPENLQGVDILFVRELVSGLYFGAAGRSQDEQGAYGFHTMRYADAEIRRIARVALQHAQQRRQHLTLAHKENALPQIPWTHLVQQEAAAFPEVTLKPMLVDTLAMQLVRHPQQFDVILAGNLFGDILSDIGGAIVGSIGLLGSASLNANGLGLYEPVHGTAPDIAGKGIANPIGMLSSMEMLLLQWGEEPAVHQLRTAQDQLLAVGHRTFDLVTSPAERWLTTQEWIDRLIEGLY